MTETFPTPVDMPIARSTPFDPPEELLRLGEERQVRPLAFPDGHVGWLVTGHVAARAVLADPRFSVRPELRRLPFPHPASEQQPMPGVFLRMDPPQHTRFRRLLTGQFTVRRMKQLEPRIQQITDACLDDMARTGPPVDLVQTFALPIPSLVICELLGVPYADRERFQTVTRTLVSVEVSDEEYHQAWRDIADYLGELVRAKQADPTDDLLGGLAGSTEVTDEELTGIATLLLLAGHETTANMLSLGTYALLRHPDQRAALTADPSRVDGAVEELLRHLSIIGMLTRTALEDVELEGQRIEAGDSVVISVSAANRAPELFDDPNALDVGRAAGRHLAFGHGVHQCLGQQLARIEMRIAYASLFKRFPALRAAVPPEDVPARDDMLIHGLHSLPVTW
ncbi:cytochrome P450 [Saccharopolyspora elongata]|uniref:Cytochrome P450 n=1 Tax=Saccharopolyspora elongata TaxID=2530387 RepID=A0A4R4ZG90_9PSEU|nr:cytochrome P450 [Saccharopolyspora elongata]TDD56644.1 cytochrome P450 [Saccharopolyspora elongata]